MALEHIITHVVLKNGNIAHHPLSFKFGDLWQRQSKHESKAMTVCLFQNNRDSRTAKKITSDDWYTSIDNNAYARIGSIHDDMDVQIIKEKYPWVCSVCETILFYSILLHLRLQLYWNTYFRTMITRQWNTTMWIINAYRVSSTNIERDFVQIIPRMVPIWGVEWTLPFALATLRAFQQTYGSS